MAQRLDAAQKKVGDSSTTTSLLAPGAYAAKFGQRAVPACVTPVFTPLARMGHAWGYRKGCQAKSPKKAPDFEKLHQKLFDVRTPQSRFQRSRARISSVFCGRHNRRLPRRQRRQSQPRQRMLRQKNSRPQKRRSRPSPRRSPLSSLPLTRIWVLSPAAFRAASASEHGSSSPHFLYRCGAEEPTNRQGQAGSSIRAWLHEAHSAVPSTARQRGWLQLHGPGKGFLRARTSASASFLSTGCDMGRWNRLWLQATSNSRRVQTRSA